MIGPELTAWCEANIASLDVVACGPAGHLAPEDQPEAIAAAIAEWAGRLKVFPNGPSRFGDTRERG